jgi:hypothetical protein
MRIKHDRRKTNDIEKKSLIHKLFKIKKIILRIITFRS